MSFRNAGYYNDFNKAIMVGVGCGIGSGQAAI
jgi:hypothetical protein